MKKNYRKPTIESVNLKKAQLLAGSGCTPQDTVPTCTSDSGCSGAETL